MGTLLEKSKKIYTRFGKRLPANIDEVEVVIAFLKGEITSGQFCGAVYKDNENRNNGYLQNKVIKILRDAAENNQIHFVIKTTQRVKG